MTSGRSVSISAVAADAGGIGGDVLAISTVFPVLHRREDENRQRLGRCSLRATEAVCVNYFKFGSRSRGLAPPRNKNTGASTNAAFSS
jgi:hypothetical protein